jgi:hypothetical protein
MIMNSVYKTAVFFVETCHWSVIPLKPGTKIPLIPWTEYQSRLPTIKELETWFLNTKNNLGVVTGKVSNLSVLDADSPEALAGVKHTSCITVLTKRGRHSYFLHTGEANSASKIAEHIDVRGEGGFVVAPPSMVDGFRYRFLSPVINHLRLDAFPRELLTNETTKSVAVKPADWISEALSKLAEGNRNHTFSQIVGRLHRDNHSASTILTLLAPHANAVQFPIGELENVIQSVTRYKNGSGPESGQTLYTGNDKAEDIETFLEGEEKVEWIVPGVLAKSSLGFMAGLPESLKTWILADLAIEASRGGEWLGHKVKRTKTLFVDQERWVGETRRRFKKMLKGKGISGLDMRDYLTVQVGTTTRLNLDESFEAFRRKLSELRPELVIVDSFATFSTVAENDRVEVQKVLERLKQLRQEFGCAILMIDHEGKSVLSPDHRGETPTAFSMVGSVAKPAAAETVFTVRRASDTSVTIYHTKSTLGSAVPPISVMLEDTPDDGIVLRKL